MRRRVPAMLALVFAWTVISASPAAADVVDIEATIAGRDVAGADSSNPIRLDPQAEIPLVMTIHNTGEGEEQIRYVRLEGKALGLTFLTYDLGVRATLPPGGVTTVDTTLDFFDLDDQATGYLGTSLQVYDTERRVIGSKSFVVDVRGNATSTLGLFAWVVLGVAAFSIVVLVANTVRRRLPSNRFVRAVQFSVAGLAVGITLALGVSILRIAFADVEAWVPVVFVPTLVAFALGYIAPGPLSQSIRDVREQEMLIATAHEAVARATGIHAVAEHHSGRHEPAGHESGVHVPVASNRSGDTTE